MALPATSAASMALRLPSVVSPNQVAAASHARALLASRSLGAPAWAAPILSHSYPTSESRPSLFRLLGRHDQIRCKRRPYRAVEQYGAIHASAADVAVLEETRRGKHETTVGSGRWVWQYNGQPISINYVEHKGSIAPSDAPPLVFLPAYSDVSTVEEWADVASALAKERRVTVIDWPGFGSSDRPPLNYTADVMEQFLKDLCAAPDGPLKGEKNPIFIGAGHAATAVLRAASRNLLTPSAVAAVAPTWGGPLPIVFGKSEKMEFRYSLLRNAIRSPGVGWALYNYLLTSPKNMRMQYLTHVYAEPDNVTPEILEKRTELTKREGARFAPASFLSGELDAVSTREEFLELFAAMEAKGIPVLVLSAKKGPRRSKAEMQALEGAKGVTRFGAVRGGLLPHEEYPEDVLPQLEEFLKTTL